MTEDRVNGDSASDVALEVRDTRARAGFFVLEPLPADAPFARGVVQVTGSDAARWLDGMVSNDVTVIGPERDRNGCYATLLTVKGRVIADLHVLAREDGFWMETAAFAVSEACERLERFIVADDVTLSDRSDDFLRISVEGPGATPALAGLSGAALEEVARECWTSGTIAGQELVMARFGFSGEDAWQLFASRDGEPALCAALADAGLPRRGTEALEVLRIEAGVPRLGPELDEEVFPDEARLDAAISRTKGCYTGQEIVARLYSRGAVNHLLVGLRFEGRPPARDAALFAGEKRSGEVTSACLSPFAGPIALGYVRREHAEPGTELRCEDPDGALDATVTPLPVVAAGSDAD